MVIFVSGHLDLTADEFRQHYQEQIDTAHKSGATFIVGDAHGTDDIAQRYLKHIGATCVVFHMLKNPRHNAGFETRGGFVNDDERDAAMTMASDADIAWVRFGRDRSGTAANLLRRQMTAKQRLTRT